MKGKIFMLTLILVAIPLIALGVVRYGFKASLTGSEVSPPVKTEATGGVILDFSNDVTVLQFTVSVQNLSDATGAYIHLVSGGKEGPPVATLFPLATCPGVKEGKFSGVLATGTITAANLEGPLKGKPLKDLLDEILAGNAFIKVQTKQHPEGELRGKIIRRPS